MLKGFIAPALVAAAAALAATGANAEGLKKEHVLLISIDGMHALDYENCVAGGYGPSRYCRAWAS